MFPDGWVAPHALTAEYGDVTDPSLKGLRSGFSQDGGATALAIPVLMVVALFVVTPAALQKKL